MWEEMMTKQGLIVILIVLMTGCSIVKQSRHGKGIDDPDNEGTINYGRLLEANVAGNGIFIKRVSAEIIIGGQKDRFTANLRASAGGEWLLSLRSFANIEIARVHADREKVTVIDRLARTATVYKWARIEREFGLSYVMLASLIGDIPPVGLRRDRMLSCRQELTAGLDAFIFRITAGCKVGKLDKLEVYEPVSGRSVSIYYSEFREIENFMVPTVVKIIEDSSLYSFAAEYGEIEIPWRGVITFEIPGGYRIIR